MNILHTHFWNFSTMSRSFQAFHGLLLFWFVFHNFGPSDGSNPFETGVEKFDSEYVEEFDPFASVPPDESGEEFDPYALSADSAEVFDLREDSNNKPSHREFVTGSEGAIGIEEEEEESDLSHCSNQSKTATPKGKNLHVPCIRARTCESVPNLQPSRIRRRFCPLHKVYCLDFDGCMIPDPIFISPLRNREKRCPSRLSLCANKLTCEYVLQKNYDDERESSLNAFNCTLLSNHLVFKNSTCQTNSDCPWNAKCCTDGGLHRQCVSYNTSTHGNLISESNSTNSTADNDSAVTRNTTIFMRNNYTNVVEGRETNFLSSMRVQLTIVLNLTTTALRKMDVKAGSVLLDVQMTATTDKTNDIDQAHGKLASLLANGSLELTDLDGKKLDIPAQMNGQPTEEPKDYTSVIIGVTASSLGATILLVLWILWNNKKRKTIKPSRNNQIISDDDDLPQLRARKESSSAVVGTDVNADSHFLALTDPQMQWELFQQSFNKPGYVWHSQDLWTTTGNKMEWPEFIPEGQILSEPARYDEPDEESKHI